MYRYLIILFLFCCKIGAAQPTKQPIIYEGKGLGNLKFGDLTGAGVKKKFGSLYTVIKHNNYAVEILYKSQKTSFYYLAGADTAKIFAITFHSGYKGRTSRGFDMSTMTVNDMLSIYGSKPDWDVEWDTKVINARYTPLGIYFSFKLKNKIPEEFELYSADDTELLKRMHQYYKSVYGKDKITETTNGKPLTNF